MTKLAKLTKFVLFQSILVRITFASCTSVYNAWTFFVSSYHYVNVRSALALSADRKHYIFFNSFSTRCADLAPLLRHLYAFQFSIFLVLLCRYLTLSSHSQRLTKRHPVVPLSLCRFPIWDFWDLWDFHFSAASLCRLLLCNSGPFHSLSLYPTCIVLALCLYCICIFCSAWSPLGPCLVLF